MSENWKTDPAYDKVHARRFALSLEWIKPLLRADSQVLELGGAGAFTKILRRDFPHAILIESNFDLRYPANTEFLEAVDSILCMEVLEHIHDQEADTPTEWRGTGTANLLAEAFAALKPGGFLFLTTPNVCSHHAIFNALTMAAPCVYRPHVREYAPSEVAAMLKAAGFTIERFETLNCWSYGTGGDRARLEKFTATYFPTEHRGDDIFVIARKPCLP